MISLETGTTRAMARHHPGGESSPITASAETPFSSSLLETSSASPSWVNAQMCMVARLATERDQALRMAKYATAMTGSALTSDPELTTSSTCMHHPCLIRQLVALPDGRLVTCRASVCLPTTPWQQSVAGVVNEEVTCCSTDPMDFPVWAPATSMAALPLVRLCSSSPMYTISSAGLNMLNFAPLANTCAWWRRFHCQSSTPCVLTLIEHTLYASYSTAGFART